MDFRDITHTLGKQTEKAKDLARKPVSLVTDPLSALHKKVKKTVFGPDLTIFVTIMHDQKLALLTKKYLEYVKPFANALRQAKRTHKKQTAVIQALKTIRESSKHETDPDERIDTLLSMIDELSYVCRHGLPGERKDGSFKTTSGGFTAEEMTLLTAQMSTFKEALKSLQKLLADDMYQALLEQLPDATGCLKGVIDLRKSFPAQEKELHTSYRTLLDQLFNGKHLLSDINQKAHDLDKATKKEQGLIGSEKTSAKEFKKDTERELHQLATSEFTQRSKKTAAQLVQIQKQTKTVETSRQSSATLWQTFFTSRQSRSKKLSANSLQAQKQQPAATKKLLKQGTITTQGMHHLFGSFDDSATLKQVQQLTTQYHQIEQVLHKWRLTLATGYRQTGMYTQLPLVAQQLLVDHRQNYLVEHLSLLREKILSDKITRRLIVESIAQLTTALHLLEASEADKKITDPLKKILNGYLRTCKDRLKTLDQELVASKAALATTKDELRDTITFRRLVAWKRHRYEEYTAGHLAQAHAEQLGSLVALKQTGVKALKQKEKKLEQSLGVAQIALEEQRKTMKLVKTAGQKTKLATLQQKFTDLQTLLKTIHELIDHIKLQKDETDLLAKKYTSTATHTLRHLSIQGRYIAATASKLNKSTLRQRVDCRGIK